MDNFDLSSIPIPSNDPPPPNSQADVMNKYWAQAQSNLQRLQGVPKPPAPVTTNAFPSNILPSIGAIPIPAPLPVHIPQRRPARMPFAPGRGENSRFAAPGAHNPIRFRIAAPENLPNNAVIKNGQSFVYSDFFSRMVPDSVNALPSDDLRSQLEFYLRERITPLLDSGVATRVNWVAEPAPHTIGFQLKTSWVPAASLRTGPAKPTPPARDRFQQRKRTFEPNLNEQRNAVKAEGEASEKKTPIKFTPMQPTGSLPPILMLSPTGTEKMSKKERKRQNKLKKNNQNETMEANVKTFTNRGIGFIPDDDELDEQRKQQRAMRFAKTGAGGPKTARAHVTGPSSSQAFYTAPTHVPTGRSIFKSLVQKCTLQRRRKIVGTCQQVEKPYFRLTSEADPSQVRPFPVLCLALDSVRKKYARTGDYTYANDQLKSIRQDILTQDIRNGFAISAYEEHVRLAIKHKDREEFNQAQQQLKVLYEKFPDSAHRLEFTAYRLLYYIYVENESDATELLQKFHTEIAASMEMKFAKKVYFAYANRQYAVMLKCYDQATDVARQVMDFFIQRERTRYLRMILAAFRPTLTAEAIGTLLHYKNRKELVEFLGGHGMGLDKSGTFDVRRYANVVLAD